MKSLRNLTLLALAATCLLALTGCPETGEHDNNGDFDAGEDVVSDADDTGGEDAEDAEDTGEDAGACDPACGGDTPLCKESTGECVECFTVAECDGDDVCTSDGRCATCETDDHCTGDEVCALADDDDPDNNVCAPCVEGSCTDGVCDVDDTDPTASECVACLGDDDCADGVCIEGATTADNSCEACRDNAECTDPAASVCNDSNECAPCSTNDDCSGISAGEVCDTSGTDGVCVECVIGQEDACASGECNPETSTCVPRTTGSKSVCEVCSSDDECMPYHYCVPMEYTGGGSAVDVGTYCLKLVSAGCERPFLDDVTRESVSGASEATYCSFSEALTTCPDYLSWKQDATCDPADSTDECGLASFADVCEDIDNASDDKCTLGCVGSADCPENYSCPNGYCER